MKETNPRRLTTIGLLVCATTWPALRADAEQNEKPVPQRHAWEALRKLAGSWRGTGEGTPGKSRISRDYKLVVQDVYLFGRTRSEFEPQEGKPKGEVHEDWEMFSYDRGRQKIVLRQFNSEGFTIQYVLKEFSPDGTRFVFVAEEIENGPPGMNARTTFTVSDDTINEVFDLAMPGKELAPCVRVNLKREE